MNYSININNKMRIASLSGQCLECLWEHLELFYSAPPTYGYKQCAVCWCVVAADLLATWSRLMFLSSSSLKPGTSTMKTCPPSVPNSSSSPEEWASTAVTLVTLGRALRCRRKDRCYHRNKINSPKPPIDLYTRTVYKHKPCFLQ